MPTMSLEQFPRSRLSSVLAAGCLLLALFMPVCTLVTALVSPETLLEPLRLPASADALTSFQLVAITVLATGPALFLSYGLLCARQCFQSFVRGEYFNVAVAKGLRGLAAGTFLATVAALLATPLLSFMVTLFAGEGQHTVTFNFGTEQLLILLFAGILWQIAGVMTRAVTLAEENSQFV